MTSTMKTKIILRKMMNLLLKTFEGISKMKEDISNELSTVRHSEIKRELIILDELERCINGKGKIYKVNQQM